jgi:LysM repeat protein
MEKRSSVLARLLAALALAAAVVVVIVIVSAATSDDTQQGQRHHRSGQTKHEGKNVKKRTKAATYTVQSGDTLTAIAHKTGVPVAEMLALNPEVDPQILIAGQVLKLR